MAWISLIFKTDAVHAELLSEALMEQGALSVDIHDAAANSHDEQPLFGEPEILPVKFGKIPKYPRYLMTALMFLTSLSISRNPILLTFHSIIG